MRALSHRAAPDAATIAHCAASEGGGMSQPGNPARLRWRASTRRRWTELAGVNASLYSDPGRDALLKDEDLASIACR
jgi:hypothetical protein